MSETEIVGHMRMVLFGWDAVKTPEGYTKVDRPAELQSEEEQLVWIDSMMTRVILGELLEVRTDRELDVMRVLRRIHENEFGYEDAEMHVDTSMVDFVIGTKPEGGIHGEMKIDIRPDGYLNLPIDLYKAAYDETVRMQALDCTANIKAQQPETDNALPEIEAIL